MQKIAYHLDKNATLPLYEQLYQKIKQAIHQQELSIGDKLPSKRKLCQHLRISQNTVENAYAQLIAEGYIDAQPRRGFYVCFQSEFTFPQSPPPVQSKHQNLPMNDKQIDFNPNRIDTQHFPFQQWKKSGQMLYQSSQQHLLTLNDPLGDLNLRQQIAHYLSASRGIHCQAEHIMIGAGFEYCIQHLILLFNQLYPHQPLNYAIEDYGYPKVEKILTLYQKNRIKLPLNPQYQLDLTFLAKQKINIAYITPSNLYPFGEIIPISQRQTLLEWANEQSDRFIIEDDYDSEFRYKGKPIPALKSLDQHNKVIYLGSFSKLLMPSLRITFMVLPPQLFAFYQQYCACFHCPISRFEQQRLATFIQQGYFEKHIHRMRKIYRKKMELLCQLLAPYKKHIRYYGENSGFHLLIELLNESRSLDELVGLAKQKEIIIYPVYYQKRTLFSLGFGHLSEQSLIEGINHLLKIWIKA
ncbi:PLP-dependent aminotransferase family protein [Rodentibacter heidelbergensis]|uniref:GntR family transcriptional regulator n=1 Tax=Rodentibacter heidelbergensis TaxID=1908258 RepID=A0A1V3I7G0_9PAST|nr:PLP-dependent aminotransferase family protein [Rodentibacter heidelbergensis]OOF35693.1 GntR family transcriptional regulator [Rodentibacter heidelbergensis]